MCDKLSSLLCSLPVCNSPSKTKQKKKVAENEEEVAIKKLSSLPVSAKQLWAIWGNTTHVEISAPREKCTAFGTQLSCRSEELSETTEKQVKRGGKVRGSCYSWKAVSWCWSTTDKLHLSRVHRRFLFTAAAQSNTSSFIPWTSAKQQLNPGANKAIPKKKFTGPCEIKVPLNYCHFARLISTNSPLSQKQTHSPKKSRDSVS